MALRWDDKKIALEIDDDLLAEPFEAPEGWQVIHINSDDLCCYSSFNRIMKQVHALVDDVPSDEDYPYDLFEIAREQVHMVRRRTAWALGRLYPYEDSMWDGELPPDSVVTLRTGEKRATPEFKFLMSAAEDTMPKTVQLGLELCGRYATDHYGSGADYILLDDPYCSVTELRDYLRSARAFKGYERAMEALEFVVEEALSPMDTYLIACLCLPRELGGYDLPRPAAGGYFDDGCDGLGRAPSEEGPYLAYDLCWPWRHVVMQYVGPKPPTARQRRSLAVEPTFDMDPVCVTTQEVRDPEAFEEATLVLASKLGISLPESNEQFVDARTRLRSELAFPDYEHMALTHVNAHFRETL